MALFDLFRSKKNIETSNGTQDEKEYKTVKIGNQVWMAKNLNESHFRNGDPIPEAKSDEEWKKAGREGKPAWCYYENKTKNGKTYGKLYNWYAVNDPRKLAPEKWHIPSKKEFETLLNKYGGEGEKVFNALTIGGLSSLFGGWRLFSGFSHLNKDAGYWSAEQDGAEYAWNLDILGAFKNALMNRLNKSFGLSVRCLKD